MPDPIAAAINRNTLKVYASASEQGIVAGLRIEPCARACEAVRAYRETFDLWKRPELPVPGCDIADECACTYRALFHEEIAIQKR